MLGETDGLGTPDPRVVVGLGLNADWEPTGFPPDLAAGMTSLSEAAGGGSIDASLVLDAFVERLESGVDDLRAGRFDDAAWESRQVTTGRTIRLETPYGDEVVRALGVNAWTGALVVDDAKGPTGKRNVLVGEIRHLRLADPIAESV